MGISRLMEKKAYLLPARRKLCWHTEGNEEWNSDGKTSVWEENLSHSSHKLISLLVSKLDNTTTL